MTTQLSPELELDEGKNLYTISESIGNIGKSMFEQKLTEGLSGYPNLATSFFDNGVTNISVVDYDETGRPIFEFQDRRGVGGQGIYKDVYLYFEPPYKEAILDLGILINEELLEELELTKTLASIPQEEKAWHTSYRFREDGSIIKNVYENIADEHGIMKIKSTVESIKEIELIGGLLERMRDNISKTTSPVS